MTQHIPLVQNEAGDLYVEGTRIFLENLLEAYEQGLSPEEIILAFPRLRLSQVYAVLAWALDHPEEVAAYRRRQKERAKEAEKATEIYRPRELLKRLGRV